MDVISLTNQLNAQPEKIITVIEKLGARDIIYNSSKGYITSTRPDVDADNKLGMMCYVDNLNIHMNTRNYSGNLYTLVMDVKKINFPQALELIASWVGIIDKPYVKVKFPFGGFYKSILKNISNPELNIKTYDDNKLPSGNNLSMKYIQDGVSAQIQEEFGVRFSLEDDAIITPIYSIDGKLIGAKARNNSDCDINKRFWAYLEYPKTLTLYGYHKNYRYIIQKKIVIVVEAEKSVLQAASFECYLVIALSGKNISKTQAKYIKALNTDKVILALDEGVCEDEIKYEASKLIVDNQMVHNKVGYVYDENNDILMLGSKDSPTDVGKDKFEILIKKYTRWI